MNDDMTNEAFNEDLIRSLAGLSCNGITADAALRAAALLIAEAPDASRQKIDQLKIMDKLLNTSRALIETRLKTGEAESLQKKLEELERELSELANQKKPKKKMGRVAEFLSFL
ncbi:MAG: hypothetical protein ACP5VS_08080 [Desulfomonilaceae bacterium]